MSNCVDVPMDYGNEAEILVKDIIYEKNAAGFVDQVHGKFIVHTRRDHKNTETIMTIYKCASDSVGICKENAKDFLENLDCIRFMTDDKAPWFMFAPAMPKENQCAESDGTYDLVGAKISAQYYEKYMTIEAGRYRIRMVAHLPGENMDVRNLRSCIELDFDILQ